MVIDRGVIRERENRAQPSHSSRSDYPFSRQPLAPFRQPKLSSKPALLTSVSSAETTELNFPSARKKLAGRLGG